MHFLTLGYASYRGGGFWYHGTLSCIRGNRNERGGLETGTSTRCDRTTTTQLANINMQHDEPPCAFFRPSRVRAPAFETPRSPALARPSSSAAADCGAGAELHDHAIEQATSRDDDGRPGAQAEQQHQSSTSEVQPHGAAALAVFGEARRACACDEPAVLCFFRQDKKRKQLPTKNNVEK